MGHRAWGVGRGGMGKLLGKAPCSIPRQPAMVPVRRQWGVGNVSGEGAGVGLAVSIVRVRACC
ncbi:hypothetical protein [Kamptonema formosum]|uniref:hypothetical protein n=1 Tax=Kamptonema formosum TaxID=331992 RepID=UPI0012DD5E54|nr:hypothetical protein [Oscillatoria sp. PCC 10802]